MAGSTTAPERNAGSSRFRRRPKAPRVVESRVPTPAASPTKNRRQPALAALAVAVLALCALAGWAAFRSVSATVPVIGVRETITKGTIIQRDDLTTMQVGQDPNLHVIPVADIDQVVGRRAATDLPAGGIIPVESVTDALVPAKGHSVIGIFARDGSAPLIGIEPGTRVRLVPLPATQEQPNPPKGATSAHQPARAGCGDRLHTHRRRHRSAHRRRRCRRGRHRRPDPGRTEPHRRGHRLPGTLMPIIVLTTAAGAPGASTTALGLTLSWPGPALLVEADPAGTSLVPGWFRGAIDPQERNIVNLALVERAEDLTEAIFDQAVSIAVDDDGEHQRLALLGLIEPVQAPALNGWWEPIGAAFQSLSAAGYAVIIDVGRCTQGSFPMPLLAVADQVLLVCRAELSGVLRSYPMATQLKATLTGTGNADAFGVVAIGNGGNRYYSGSAIAKQLGVQFALSLPDDPLSAAALSDGLALPPRLPARIRSRFTRHTVVADEDLDPAGGEDDVDAVDDPAAEDFSHRKNSWSGPTSCWASEPIAADRRLLRRPGARPRAPGDPVAREGAGGGVSAVPDGLRQLRRPLRTTAPTVPLRTTPFRQPLRRSPLRFLAPSWCPPN